MLRPMNRCSSDSIEILKHILSTYLDNLKQKHACPYVKLYLKQIYIYILLNLHIQTA
jgi:hypothetical protein